MASPQVPSNSQLQNEPKTTKNKILEFLKTHQDGVVSTVSPEGHPEAATVGFSETEDLEIIFGTNRSSRKYRNIQHNPRVAVVIGFSGDITVQYEGVARELAEPELSQRLEAHFVKVPSARNYQAPDQTYFVIDPAWI
jgi:general stress protein 26